MVLTTDRTSPSAAFAVQYSTFKNVSLLRIRKDTEKHVMFLFA